MTKNIQATVSLMRMMAYNPIPVITLSNTVPQISKDYEQLKKEYCCGACGTVFIATDQFCIECGVKL